MKYYTRLPTFAALIEIFTFVSSSLEENSRTTLSHFQQFVSGEVAWQRGTYENYADGIQTKFQTVRCGY